MSEEMKNDVQLNDEQKFQEEVNSIKLEQEKLQERLAENLKKLKESTQKLYEKPTKKEISQASTKKFKENQIISLISAIQEKNADREDILNLTEILVKSNPYYSFDILDKSKLDIVIDENLYSEKSPTLAAFVWNAGSFPPINDKLKLSTELVDGLLNGKYTFSEYLDSVGHEMTHAEQRKMDKFMGFAGHEYDRGEYHAFEKDEFVKKAASEMYFDNFTPEETTELFKTLINYHSNSYINNFMELSDEDKNITLLTIQNAFYLQKESEVHARYGGEYFAGRTFQY